MIFFDMLRSRPGRAYVACLTAVLMWGSGVALAGTAQETVESDPFIMFHLFSEEEACHLAKLEAKDRAQKKKEPTTTKPGKSGKDDFWGNTTPGSKPADGNFWGEPGADTGQNKKKQGDFWAGKGDTTLEKYVKEKRAEEERERQAQLAREQAAREETERQAQLAQEQAEAEARSREAERAQERADRKERERERQERFWIFDKHNAPNGRRHFHDHWRHPECHI